MSYAARKLKPGAPTGFGALCPAGNKALPMLNIYSELMDLE